MPRFLRFSVLLLTLLLLLATLPAFGTNEREVAVTLPPPTTAAPTVSAACAALFDPVSGCFLLSKNADERRPMASTTKIMTALVVLTHCDLTDTVLVPREAVGVEGSSIYLFENEEITVETLLYALLLNSANDAAVALAIHAAGSVAAFADLMNEKAAALHLTSTHFTNPHGLYDEAHYTTARELALITAAALENEVFAKIVATKRYSVPQNGTDATRLFLNHNRLLRTYEGAIGVKTGFTKKSGRCLVSAAKNNDLTLIAVTLDAPNDWQDHTAMLDWGFAEYEGFCPMPEAITLPVVGGVATEVALTPDGSLSLTLPRAHAEIACTLEAPRFLFAGFAAGKEVGRLVYRMDGKVIGTVSLKTANGVEKSKLHRTFFQKIQDIFIK
ncbi:MAG: D-alanyl-D-alanine carboxypeptidase [Clostridia bacterium]|nr:D-alanyl-D-alanine carboxypeptidase [Clostridia bacterium]